jgi:hypothetical protein
MLAGRAGTGFLDEARDAAELQAPAYLRMHRADDPAAMVAAEASAPVTIAAGFFQGNTT